MGNPKFLALAAGGAALAVLAGSFLSVDIGFGSSASAAPSVLTLLQEGADAEGSSEHEARLDAYLARLAENLGIDVDTLTQALKTTSLQELDARVADGTLTQEQADAIRTRIEEGDGYFFGPGRGFGHPARAHGMHFAGVPAEEIATFLGVEVDALRQDLRDGSSLAQVAEAAGVSRQELITFLTNEATTAIQEKVDSGDITQEQADERLANLPDRINEYIDSTCPAPQRNGSDSGAGFFRGSPGRFVPRG